MSYTAQFSEQNVPLAVHYPLTRQVAAHVSDWVLMSKYHRAFFLLSLGAMGSSATVDAKLQEATNATGSGARSATAARKSDALSEPDDRFDSDEHPAMSIRCTSSTPPTSADPVFNNFLRVGCAIMPPNQRVTDAEH